MIFSWSNRKAIFIICMGLVFLCSSLSWFFWKSSQVPEVHSYRGMWSATIETDEGKIETKLPLPFTFATEGIPTNATVTMRIPISDLHPKRQMSVYAERPLRSIMLGFDEEPVAGWGSFSNVNHQGPGMQFAMAEIPKGAREINLHLKGELGEGGLLGDLLAGETKSVQDYRTYRNAMAIFIVASLCFGAFINLSVAATRQNRREFISLGVLLCILAVYILSRSDSWYLVSDSMEMKIRMRHIVSSLACSAAVVIPPIVIEERKKIVPFIVYTGITIALVGLFWREGIYFISNANKVFGILVIFFSTYWLAEGSLKGKWDARIMLGSMFILVAVSLSDWPVQWGLVPRMTHFIFPAWMLFILVICTTLFLRFSLRADRLGVLTTLAKDAIIVVKSDGSVKEANPAARQLIKGLAKGDKLTNHVIDSDLQKIQNHLKIGGPNQELFHLREKPQVRLESVATDLPLRERLLALRDTSEREELEKNLLNAAKMETVGLVAGGIAHDFNNILTALIGRTELIVSDLPSNQKHLQNMTSLLQRMAHMVRRLLTLSRGGMDKREVLYVNDVLESCDQLAQGILPASTTLHIHINDPKVQIYGAHSEMEQVFLNLIINARDAIKGENGRISISVSKQSGGTLSIVVEDNGSGIPKDIQNRIWTPFFSTKKKTQGVGIGLSVVSRIIQDHGGSIRHRNKEGSNGSLFEIHLPIIGAIDSSNPISQAESPKNKIMIVDDEPAVLDLMKSVLEQRGFVICAFENATIAMDKFDDLECDLLITDVSMPDINGIELASNLSDRNPHLRTLLVSGYSTVDREMLPNRWNFLAKPFTAEQLVSSVRRLMLNPFEKTAK